jgi:hypothetical protein
MWSIDGCGELLDESEGTLWGPGPHVASQRVRTNGLRGTVTCIVLDGTSSCEKLFHINARR